MNTALSFQAVQLQPVFNDNKVWITSSDLAKALGYVDTRSVTKIYNRNSDEFTEQMTEVVNLTPTGKNKDLQNKTRLFSLRGCHLVGMFAKTQIAKAFRRWILDLIEQEQSRFASELKTTSDERTGLRNAINALVSKKSMMYPEAYNLIHQRFNIAHINELKQEQVALAVEYIHRLILDSEKKEAKAISTNMSTAMSHIPWVCAWYFQYEKAFRILNPKMSGSIHDHFQDMYFAFSASCNELKNKTRTLEELKYYPWDKSYHDQQRFLENS